ncbi:VOC family protein [Pelagibius marinus]|uniref:VOC family protein n=1 Tax=Pelagibius marinus TaxID=2762760 RepID=UPI001873277B|nr:VOC family protein [Pelagibius marinus]
MSETEKPPFPDADTYGRSLTGFGVNLLVRDVAATLAFLTEVLGVEVVYADRDFAVCRHGGQEWMLHSDASYHANPLLALTGDGAIRGAGLELRLYGIDPDAAAAKAEAAGHAVLQPATDKPHGLREAYIAGPDGYVWVPSVHKAAKDQP